MDFGRAYKNTAKSMDFNSAIAPMDTSVQRRPRAQRVKGPDEFQMEQDRAAQELMTMTYEQNMEEYLEEERNKEEEKRKREMINQSKIVRRNMFNERAIMTARDVVLEQIAQQNNGILPDAFIKRAQGRKRVPVKPKPKTIGRPKAPVKEITYYVVEEVVVQPKPRKPVQRIVDDDCIVVEQFEAQVGYPYSGQEVVVQPKPRRPVQNNECIVVEQFEAQVGYPYSGQEVVVQPKPRRPVQNDECIVVEQFEEPMFYPDSGEEISLLAGVEGLNGSRLGF